MPQPSRTLAPAIVAAVLVVAGSASLRLIGRVEDQAAAVQPRLSISQDQNAGTISVFRPGRSGPILTQNAAADRAAVSASSRRPRRPRACSPRTAPRTIRIRPACTGDSPPQRPRLLPQPAAGTTGGACSVEVLHRRGDEAVRWQTVYDLLDAGGQRRADRNPALGDAREERHASCSISSGAARRRPTSRSAATTTAACSCACRGGRGSRARWSTPHGSATHAPRGSARCGSTSA